jgi:ribosome modulation factor
MANLSAPSTNITDATRIDFLRRATRAKQELESAEREAKSLRGSYRAVLKEGKAAGVTPDEITFALQMRFMDPDEIMIMQRNRIRILALSGIMPTIQQDLFGAPEHNIALSDEEKEKIAAERAYDDGYFRGNNGDNRTTNPNFQGTETFDAWERGWIAGQAKIVHGMTPKIKAPRAARKGKVTAEAVN